MHRLGLDEAHVMVLSSDEAVLVDRVVLSRYFE